MDSNEKRELRWKIHSINVHLEKLQNFWGKSIGISGPQWKIISALAELDVGEGVPVNLVSKKLHVDPSFVTTQSKLLEKSGFIRRKMSIEDARIVKMSLRVRPETLGRIAEFSEHEAD